MSKIFAILAIAIALFICCPALADREKGSRAYFDGDYATAFRELLPLAKKGNSSAQFYVGWIYRNGLSVPQNDQEAEKWLKLARLIGGEAAFNFNSAVQHYYGWGVPQNYSEAAKFYKLSAEQGYSGAQASLAGMYNDGEGVPQNYKEGVKWLKLSAEQGDISGLNNLGTAYKNGKGVLQNYVRAHMWFNLAAAKGLTFSAEQRDKVAELMTPKQIAEAQKLAIQCLEKEYKGC